MSLSIREARKIAESMKYRPEYYLFSCTDIGDSWVFHFDADVVVDGNPTDVEVNKESGMAGHFIAFPGDANDELLEYGTSVPVDDYAGAYSETHKAVTPQRVSAQ